MLSNPLPSIRLPHVKMNAVLDSEAISTRSKPWKKYVQDGLNLIYDVSNGLTSSEWRSIKINGVEGSEQTLTADNPVQIVGGVPVFDGSAYFEIDGEVPYSDKVVEVCFKMTSNSAGRVVLYNDGFYATSGCTLLDYNSSTGKYLFSSVRDSSGTSYGRQISVTLNDMCTIADSKYKDGEEITSSWTSGSNSGDDNHYVGNNLKGSIYSIRVYDKDKYSASVAAANYQVDLQRFGSKQFTLDESQLDGKDWLG